MVGYGRGPIPNGRLPVFSVGSEKEAKLLITMACPTNIKGEYIAPELAEEQTLERLYAFGDRLRALHARIKNHCECT